MQSLGTHFRLRWNEGKRATQGMRRAVNAVVTNSCVYIRPWGEDHIFGYDLDNDNWLQLPDCPYQYASLAHVCHFLTSVGGEKDTVCTNKLLSLTWKESDQLWVEVLPPMPTKRKNPICVTAEVWLVVSGGIQAETYLMLVELLDIENKVWSAVASLPEPMFNASVTLGEGHIYLLGGNRKPGQPTTTVLTCKLEQLVKSSGQNAMVWKQLRDLPVKRSSCAWMYGQLLAIGGEYDNSHTPTLPSASVHACSSVYRYNVTENTWSIISDLGVPVSECFTTVLPGNKLMIVGGNTKQGLTNRVLFGMADLH